MGNVTSTGKKKGADTNREIKNSVFCDLFSDRKNALSLYNAINGTDYTDENELEIATIDEVIYLHQKNDVSVLFDSKLTLWEHQSTLSYNMPVRGLMYYSRNLEGIMGEGIRKLYRRNVVKIPAPDYYVLYNGEGEMPDRLDMRLSEAFMVPSEGYEFTAHMININEPHNKELMNRCPALSGYATLIEYTRKNIECGMQTRKAVDKAVERCISEGILKDYLLKKRAEAVSMFLTEFDEKAWEKTIREEALEEERQNTERERQKAEMERLRAEKERQNAEMERQRADRAEARIAELEALLKQK